jgi:HD-GYP domain-containing protein (c-di-GMP phosphodiesterase class II)
LLIRCARIALGNATIGHCWVDVMRISSAFSARLNQQGKNAKLAESDDSQRSFVFRRKSKMSRIAAKASPRFIGVSVSTILPSTVSGVAFFQRDSPHAPARLYRGPDYPFQSSDIKQLLERGIHTLYVASDEYHQYQHYLRDNLSSILEDETRSVEQRFGNLNEVVRDVVGAAFKTQNVDKTVEATKEVAQHTVDLICREDAVASELCDVMFHDYNTFTHSTNVTYYCVLLANRLGIGDKDDLHAIAVGALLHDLGKLGISEAILNKPGPLSDAEFDIIKRHPADGLTKLCSREDLNFGQLMIVYQHHERLDGQGYPVGLVEDEIHPWAKLCAVVDVYEALTSHRPYRSALSPSEAFKTMDRDEGSALDKGMYQCWKEMIQGNSPNC